ncbi:NAD(P)-binding protein [Lojkania enalia]|uniref:NAD(P)-binding protein n=1 Tax=Lojkania enalia TaxID=147567 RepID=A0A9P4K6L0_9PLEO|nr:NAD(P)-binding protein [Didymosphaeria enalia]
MSKKLLVVFGATGNQGGSVANFVLDDPKLSQQYSVRALTRDASNAKAQALQLKGAEIVEADMDKPESIIAALNGAHTIFLVTNTQYSADTRAIETKQAKAVCEEAVKQGIQYLIWSSMSHPEKLSNGELTKVEHFDVKAEIEDWIRSLPIKSSFFAPGSFMQNFLNHNMAPRPSPANDGTYVVVNLCHPNTKLALIDITDTGKWVGAILAEPDRYEGKFIAAATRLYDFEEIVTTLSKVSGKKVTFQQVPDDIFKGFLPESYREQLFEMYLLFRDFGYFGSEMKEKVEWAAEQARAPLTTFEEFLKKNEFKLQ